MGWLSLLTNRYVWVALALAGMGLAVTYEKHRANKWEGEYEKVSQSFAAFRAEVSSIGAAAQKRAEEQAKKQDNATKEVRVDYAKTRTAVDTYYSLRLRDKPASAGGGVVSTPADSPQGPDESAAECRASYASLERRSALDASQLQAWIDWAKAQGLPVGDD